MLVCDVKWPPGQIPPLNFAAVDVLKQLFIVWTERHLARSPCFISLHKQLAKIQLELIEGGGWMVGWVGGGGGAEAAYATVSWRLSR